MKRHRATEPFAKGLLIAKRLGRQFAQNGRIAHKIVDLVMGLAGSTKPEEARIGRNMKARRRREIIDPVHIICAFNGMKQQINDFRIVFKQPFDKARTTAHFKQHVVFGQGR